MDITLHDGVTSIDNGAFYNCSSLTGTLTIPNSVTSIGTYAFYNCSGLTSVTIGNSVTSIGSYAFYYCSGLTSVTIPDGVTSIEWGAFYNCSGLTSVTIGNSVTSIGGGAFSGCSGLTSVTIPDSVTSIGEGAFFGCGNCMTFDFKDATSVPTLGNVKVFQGTPTNREIIVPDNLYDSWISTENWSSNDYYIRQSIVKCSQSSLAHTTTHVKYTTQSGLSDWYGQVYGEIAGTNESPYYTTQIPNVQYAEEIVQIGSGVTSIGDYAFRGCNNLTSVILPSSLTNIGYMSFYYCSSLTSVTIPDSVTSIGEGAFYNCSGLTSVTIGNGVTSIGNWAFSDCSNCLMFDFRNATSVPTLGGVDAFYDTSANKKIIVPDELYDTWIAASNWSSSTNGIVDAIIKTSGLTYASYTQASGLSDWNGVITG